MVENNKPFQNPISPEGDRPKAWNLESQVVIDISLTCAHRFLAATDINWWEKIEGRRSFSRSGRAFLFSSMSWQRGEAEGLVNEKEFQAVVILCESWTAWNIFCIVAFGRSARTYQRLQTISSSIFFGNRLSLVRFPRGLRARTLVTTVGWILSFLSSQPLVVTLRSSWLKRRVQSWPGARQENRCSLCLVFRIGHIVFSMERERRRRQLPTTKLRTWVLVCLVGSLVSSPPLSRLHQHKIRKGKGKVNHWPSTKRNNWWSVNLSFPYPFLSHRLWLTKRYL